MYSHGVLVFHLRGAVSTDLREVWSFAGFPVVAANVTEALATLTLNSRPADIHTNSEAPQRATSIVLAFEKMRVPEDTDGLSNPRRSHDRTDAKKDARWGSGALRGPWQ